MLDGMDWVSDAISGGMSILLGWVPGGMCSDQLKSYLPNYPPVIKRGNVKSPMNGGFNGKIIYEWYIFYCPCLITGGKTTWQKNQLLLIATQVVERGTYSELVSLGGHFAKLAARSLWENWRAAGPARKQALSCWAVPMTLGKWSILQAEKKKVKECACAPSMPLCTVCYSSGMMACLVLFSSLSAGYPCLDSKKGIAWGTRWCPPVISWFISPLTIDISPINHSYWSYKPT